MSPSHPRLIVLGGKISHHFTHYDLRLKLYRPCDIAGHKKCNRKTKLHCRNLLVFLSATSLSSNHLISKSILGRLVIFQQAVTCINTGPIGNIWSWFHTNCSKNHESWKIKIVFASFGGGSGHFLEALAKQCLVLWPLAQRFRVKTPFVAFVWS